MKIQLSITTEETNPRWKKFTIEPACPRHSSISNDRFGHMLCTNGKLSSMDETGGIVTHEACFMVVQLDSLQTGVGDSDEWDGCSF